MSPIRRFDHVGITVRDLDTQLDVIVESLHQLNLPEWLERTALCGSGRRRELPEMGPITDEGVGVGGAFDSDTATGMIPVAHRVAGVRSFRRS